jgi:hypothetical protein
VSGIRTLRDAAGSAQSRREDAPPHVEEMAVKTEAAVPSYAGKRATIPWHSAAEAGG